MKLDWVMCKGDLWCPLATVDLQSVDAVGVYVIWKPGGLPSRNVICVGQGGIGDRLLARRGDYRVQFHEGVPGLLVTWAAVPDQRARDGVERFLADSLRPLVGDRHPDAAPVSVNLPNWQAAAG